MSNELIAGLRQIAASRWRQSPSDAGVKTWLPLLPISQTGIWLGLGMDGDWVLGRLSGPVASSGEKLSQAWLTMLDSDEQEVRGKLSQAAAEFDLNADILIARLPIDDVLTMAMRSGSGHWAGRAVSWLSNRSVNDNQRILLSDLVNARWVDQRTRHNARHILRG